MNGPRVDVPIADVIAGWNAKNPDHADQLASGVYEFAAGKDACQDDDCKRWTAAQVRQACVSANAHPGLVRKIVVGNENLGDDSPASRVMADRMASDILTIRGCLSDRAVFSRSLFRNSWRFAFMEQTALAGRQDGQIF